MARKTKSEKRAEYGSAQDQAWREFEPKLAALKSFVEAELLVNQAPPQDSPGRPFYSNLGFFLQQFTVPFGATSLELQYYLEFTQRLDAAGALKPKVRDRVAAAIEARIGELDPP